MSQTTLVHFNIEFYLRFDKNWDTHLLHNSFQKIQEDTHIWDDHPLIYTCPKGYTYHEIVMTDL
jgi:hypothetical protein